MAGVAISINGRKYDISCDSGQESRVSDLASYIDQRLKQIASSGAAYNDAHLMVLTLIVLADELFDVRTDLPAAASTSSKHVDGQTQEDNSILVDVIQQLTDRLETIATKVEAA